MSVQSEGEQLCALYAGRFQRDVEFRRQMWHTLCRNFFQRWIPVDATVLDLAAGSCEFINAIKARERIAVDINPAVQAHADEHVTTYVTPADKIPVPDGSIDRVFVSNFFEHIDRPTILAVMSEVRRILKPAGQFLVLQPNIRFCGRDYWMFFDHITPIDDRALKEALELAGFTVTHQVTRFLPFTTKSRLPKSAMLVRAYLAARPLWRLLGQQSFLVAAPSRL